MLLMLAMRIKCRSDRRCTENLSRFSIVSWCLSSLESRWNSITKRANADWFWDSWAMLIGRAKLLPSVTVSLARKRAARRWVNEASSKKNFPSPSLVFLHGRWRDTGYRSRRVVEAQNRVEPIPRALIGRRVINDVTDGQWAPRNAGPRSVRSRRAASRLRSTREESWVTVASLIGWLVGWVGFEVFTNANVRPPAGAGWRRPRRRRRWRAAPAAPARGRSPCRPETSRSPRSVRLQTTKKKTDTKSESEPVSFDTHKREPKYRGASARTGWAGTFAADRRAARRSPGAGCGAAAPRRRRCRWPDAGRRASAAASFAGSMGKKEKRNRSWVHGSSTIERKASTSKDDSLGYVR